MPIEIKELVIRAEVGSKDKPRAQAGRITKEQRQQLVQDCVDQVLEILKEKKER